MTSMARLDFPRPGGDFAGLFVVQFWGLRG